MLDTAFKSINARCPKATEFVYTPHDYQATVRYLLSMIYFTHCILDVVFLLFHNNFANIVDKQQIHLSELIVKYKTIDKAQVILQVTKPQTLGFLFLGRN
jgi:hypothetical protein